LRVLPRENWADDLWDLLLFASQVPETVARAADSLELSAIARFAFDLSGRLHAVYNKHRILDEPDANLRRARLAAFQAFRIGLEELCGLLGVPNPERM
jgi:arginyl-tRNA synthetase